MAGFGANYFINHGVVFNSEPAVEVKEEKKQAEVVKPTPVSEPAPTVEETPAETVAPAETVEETFSTGNGKKNKNKRGEA